MTTAEYVQAQLPDAPVILGVTLRPFAVGHALMLERVRNSFSWDALREAGGAPISGSALGDLLLAIEICQQEPFHFVTALRLAQLKTKHARVPAPVLHTACTEFAGYILSSFRCPKIWQEPDAEGKSTGVPLLVALKLGLMARLGKSEEQALKTPVHLALMDLAALNALEGKLELVTEEEQALMAAAAQPQTPSPIT